MASLEATCSSLDIFLALTKAEHFLLYLPSSGHALLSFLDSCFHRSFTQHLLQAHNFREVAVFTEPAWLGRIFILFSRRGGGVEFTMENSRALQETGVFGRAFGEERTGLFPAYAVEENALLMRQDAFWKPDRMGGRPGADVDVTGAQTLRIYAGVRDGVYDIKRQMFLSKPEPHTCEGARWPCATGVDGDATSLDWEDLFPPPWDKPYTGIFKMSPYMALNILTSELGPLVRGRASQGKNNEPLSEPQPVKISQTMENADRILHRAKKSIHEFGLRKKSIPPKLEQRLSEYGGILSGSAGNTPQPGSNTSPLLVQGHTDEPPYSPSTAPDRSNEETSRSSPAPAFQDSSRPPPSMDVTRMLLDKLRKTKPSSGSLTSDGSRSKKSYGNEAGLTVPQESTAGINLTAGGGGSAPVALDPSTLDMLVRKLEAVKNRNLRHEEVDS